MPLLSEWSKYDHTQFEEKKQEKQQNIPLENKILFETAAEESEIQRLKSEHKINREQEEALERAKKCAHELFPDKPECQKDLFNLEEKEIRHQISIGEEMELLEMEMNPKDHIPDNNDDIKTTISKFVKKAKNTIGQLIGSKE